MVYNSRYRRKRSYRPRSTNQIKRRWNRKKTSSTQKMILSNRRLARKVQKDIEIKYLEDVPAGPPAYTGQYTEGPTVDFQGLDINTNVVGLCPLNGLYQGTDNKSRIGSWITLKRITCRYSVQAGYGNTPPAIPIDPNDVRQYVTICIVADKCPATFDAATQSSLPGWSNIFYTPDPAVFHPNMTFRELSKLDRFKILKKKTVLVKINQPKWTDSTPTPSIDVDTGLLANGTNEVRGSMQIKLPFKFQYDDTLPIPQPTNQNIYIIACSNVRLNPSVSGANLPILKLSCRVAYRDG